jgi:DNA-binding beta-propeller fold protein YncE
MVLRNVNSGAFEVYDIANNALTGATSLGSVGLDWQVAGIAPDPSGTAAGAAGVELLANNAVSQLVQTMASVPSTKALDAVTTNSLDTLAAQQGFLAAHS